MRADISNMPMTNADIQTYYRDHWGKAAPNNMTYSSPVEDAAIYPVYERLIADLSLKTSGRLLDIGCGSGRWVRFFLDRFHPREIVGLDFAETSTTLLDDWAQSLDSETKLSFKAADVSEQGLPIDGVFDLINVGNVLFHVPETDKFERALANIAAALDTDGRVVSTEYLPRHQMRTEWMLVRSRYEFEALARRAGLEITHVRPCSFFSNDPLGLDGPDNGTRAHFYAVKQMSQQLLQAIEEPQAKQFVAQMLSRIEHACLAFGAERVPPMDMPAQKLVVLRKR